MRMSECKYNWNGKTLNQQQLIEAISEEILSDVRGEKYPELRDTLFKVDTQAEIISKLEKAKSFANGKNKNNGWLGVSEYMDMFHDLGKIGLNGQVVNSLLFPVYNEEARLENEVIRISTSMQMNEPGETRSRQEIEAEIRIQFADERLSSYIGDAFHDFVGIILTKGQGSNEMTQAIEKAKKKLSVKHDGSSVSPFEWITSQNPIALQQMIDVLVDRAQMQANEILRAHQGASFFSEIPIATDNCVSPTDANNHPVASFKGINGRSDLVIVDPDGQVTILDFKVATTHFADWCAAKKYHTEYQLGFYRHILAANGIDGSKVKLEVAPIYVAKGDVTEMQPEGIQDLLAPGRHNVSRLDWESGDFTANIRKMITIPFQVSEAETPAIVDEINASLSDLITYQPKERSYDKDDFVERFVTLVKDNGKEKYVFYDWTEHGKPYYCDTKEEFKKEGGVIDKFNEKLAKLIKQHVKSITKDIEEARKKGLPQSELDFLQAKKSSAEIAKHLTAAFGLYTNPEYRLVDIPVLMDFGVIAYENTTTGTIYFTALTDQMLDAKVDNNGQTTVLGNFYSNDEVRHLKGVQAMDATCGNMELIKVMHIINTLYDKFPDQFANKKIGNIEVINAAYGSRRSVDLETLKDNYGILIDKDGQFKNHFTNDIETSDVWEALVSDVNRAIIDASEDKNLKECLSGLKHNETNKNRRLEQIEEAIKKMKKHYPKFAYADYRKERSFDLNRPEDQAYIILNETYDYLLGIPISYNGEISKWGLHFGEVIKILTIPFIKDQSNTLYNGVPSKGLGTGIEMTSPQTVPSETLRALYQYYDIAFIKVREDYAKARAVINRITQPYIAKRESATYKALIGTKYSIWENLLVKNSDGSISETLMLKNPYSDKTLSQEDSDFLKAILWEINKYRLHLSSDLAQLNYLDDAKRIEQELVTNTKLTSALQKQYFELPLRRATDFLRLKNIGRIGITSYFQKKLKQGADEYDPRQLHSSHSSRISDELKKDSCDMFNAYDLSVKERQDLISREGAHDFEIDLDYLTSDVAFQAIRQNYFEKVLLITDTLATTLHFTQQTTDRSHQTEIEGMDDQSKVIKGETLIPNELKEAASGIGFLKRFNSLMVLALRPMQFIKELTFGQITNYSRAWALKGTGQEISATSVFNANKVIWGQSAHKYGEAFSGEGDISDYTMCEAINKVYGFANEDLNRTVESSTQQRHGVVQNYSRWMYISNSAPDYFNRLTLFIARMMDDGCWEAHTLNEDGTLNYDFTKDKRFSELKLDDHGNIIKPTSEKGLQQLGLYRAMAEDFEREGKSLMKVVNGQEIMKPLPRAYTINQRNSIKEIADLAYGFYDHEAKSLIDHKFIGLVWKQFMTFWTAKVQLWFRGRPLSAGDNTSQGKFVQCTENGEKLWRRVVQEANGKIAVYEVRDSELRPEEVGKLEPVWGWQGDYSEGLIYSIMGTFYDIFHADFAHLRNDKQQLANLKLALHDILIGVILFNLLKFIFSSGTNKMKDVHPTQRIILRAMQDVGPQSITSISWEPGFYTTLTNTKNDVFKLLTDDHDIQKAFQKRMGAIKDFTWDEDKK